MTENYRVEDIDATRIGGMALATAPFKKEFRWVASTSIGREDATVTEDLESSGHLTMIEAAGGLQYERKRFRAESAAGFLPRWHIKCSVERERPENPLLPVALYRTLSIGVRKSINHHRRT
jgi:hypothetical protein